jgi:P-type Ca2+ transporter type 2C
MTTDPDTKVLGLTHVEAAQRLKQGGPNQLPVADKRTLFKIMFEVLREPMLGLLIGGGLVYLLIGDVKEAIVLLFFACLSVLITVVQEARTEQVLSALRDLSSPKATVIRDGLTQQIACASVVRGDIIRLAEGERVPADGRLVSVQDLSADESLLTGESVPVRKVTASDQQTVARPGGDDLPFVYSGSLIVRGSGLAEVTATGQNSEIGKIGQSLAALETTAPHLKQQTQKLVGLFAVVGGVVSLLVVVLYGTLRGSWLEAILAGIAVGMSMLPEEFPVVLAVFMAMGAWRISKARVLTRRATAIEALGSASVLCTDKTGTLTQNLMTIRDLRLPDGSGLSLDSQSTSLSDPFQVLIRSGVLASSVEPFDPMEKAFHTLGKALSIDQILPTSLVKTYPLRPEYLVMSNVWRGASDQDPYSIAAKGAPEAMADLCQLTPDQRAHLKSQVDEMAGAGLRVLGVAQAVWAEQTLPETQQEFKWVYLGLIGLADPLRPNVPAAIKACKAAGIRVVMITGDYPQTAKAIARGAGLDEGDVLTGDVLATLSDAQLAQRIRAVSVFARIMPEQKLKIVAALKANGAVVAMTGDGVNDAPSLKAADIGIAMGGRGTDVAREAAAIVLLDDDFGAIVTTVKLGRRIYDNLRKAMRFIFAVHVPIAGLALLPLLFGLPILLGPMHIAFLEMVIDPVCSLVFEAESAEEDVMNRPPRDAHEPLFSKPMIGWSLIQGALAFVVVASIFVMSLWRGMAVDEVRAMTFLALIMSVVALILVNRSQGRSLLKAIMRPNKALVIILMLIGLMLGVTLFVPVVADLFRFKPLSMGDVLIALSAGVFVLIGLEAVKPKGHNLLKPNPIRP